MIPVQLRLFALIWVQRWELELFAIPWLDQARPAPRARKNACSYVAHRRGKPPKPEALAANMAMALSSFQFKCGWWTVCGAIFYTRAMQWGKRLATLSTSKQATTALRRIKHVIACFRQLGGCCRCCQGDVLDVEHLRVCMLCGISLLHDV